jgi:methylenetetrahydrofolate dehydrogenase (NAD+)
MLKDGVVAVNFSSHKNMDDSVKQKASIFVPSVGKVTVAMLQRNLLRLFQYQQ